MLKPGLFLNLVEDDIAASYVNIDLIYTATYSTRGEILEHSLVILNKKIEEIS
jgi:hypothetical protein